MSAGATGLDNLGARPLLLSLAGLELIRRWESLRLAPYLCPAGYWTIGYGAIWGPDGARVTALTAPVTPDLAQALLARDCRIAQLGVTRNVRPALTQGEFDALTSFVFNLGETRFRHSTLLMQLNREQFAACPGEFLKWDRAGGRVLRGLRLRREAEVRRFLDRDAQLPPSN